MTTKEQVTQSLIMIVERLGFPAEFGEMLAAELKTEKQITRMAAWLVRYSPKRMEDVVDEMLAIKAEFQKYTDKKIAEYANCKYNEWLNGDERVADGCGEDY